MGRVILGAVLIALGIVAGLYVGIWWAFIGGIIQVIKQVRAEHLEAIQVAYGVAKIVFAGLAGWLSAIVLILPGIGMIGWGLDD